MGRNNNRVLADRETAPPERARFAAWGPTLPDLRSIKHPAPRRLGRVRVLILIGCACLFQAGLHAQEAAGQSVTAANESATLEMFTMTAPVKPGDRCIVCGVPLRPCDKVFLVEGQRVGVTKAMERDLRGDPWTYIGRLRPRGGLFGGETTPSSYGHDRWLLFGIYIIAGLAFAAACSHRALSTGQPALPWFLTGLVLNVVGYAALLLRPSRGEASLRRHNGLAKIPATAVPQTCAVCQATNHPSAASCIRCSAELSPSNSSEVDRLGCASE